MNLKRRRKVMLVGIAIPTVLLLSGFIGLRLTEARLAADIAEERRELLQLGIDLTPVTAAEDAYDEYIAALQMASAGKSDEAVLVALEKATTKKYVAFELHADPKARDKELEEARTHGKVSSPLFFWEFQAIQRRSLPNRWSMIDRIYAINEAFRRQTELGRSKGNLNSPLSYDDPLAHFTSGDKKERDWLRRKLEAKDLKSDLLLKLNRFGRDVFATQAETVPFDMRSLLSTNGWRELPARQKVFRLSVQRSVHRALFTLVRKVLQMPVEQAFKVDLQDELSTLLKAESSEPAELAARNLSAVWWESRVDSDVLNRRIDLIYLDLADSRERGKPLVPTWSKRYCYDPSTGTPIAVKATPAHLKFQTHGFGAEYQW